MFSFMGMAGNYDSRKVARFEDAGTGLVVSTAEVIDGAKPYETAITHPDYNEGEWVVVEAYASKKAAQTGHNRWVKTMQAKRLPKELVDCCNSEIGQMFGGLGGEVVFKRKGKDNA